jgi:hypothetical protein
MVLFLRTTSKSLNDISSSLRKVPYRLQSNSRASKSEIRLATRGTRSTGEVIRLLGDGGWGRLAQNMHLDQLDSLIAREESGA